MTVESPRPAATSQRLDDPRRVQPRRRWLRLLPIRTEHRKDRAIAHAALWILGSAALSLLSFVCFLLGFNFTTTAFILLVAIVLLSLLGSFASAAIFSRGRGWLAGLPVRRSCICSG
ncbi:CHASE2 domain-containing sensor protein [Bradyrhizobium japonicum]